MLYLIMVCTCLFTLLGGLFAFYFEDKLHLIAGFSAGTVIGISLFDLIPESYELGLAFYDYNLISLYMSFGFMIYMMLDRTFSLHFHDKPHKCDNISHKNKLSATTLIVHSFIDGLGIGVSFQISPMIGIIVAVAVISHNFADGINIVNVFNENIGNKKNNILKFLYIGSLAPFFGILASFIIKIPENIFCLIIAIFSGSFLYIGASQLLPESFHHHKTIGTTLMSILAIILICLITNIAH